MYEKSLSQDAKDGIVNNWDSATPENSEIVSVYPSDMGSTQLPAMRVMSDTTRNT